MAAATMSSAKISPHGPKGIFELPQVSRPFRIRKGPQTLKYSISEYSLF